MASNLPQQCIECKKPISKTFVCMHYCSELCRRENSTKRKAADSGSSTAFDTPPPSEPSSPRPIPQGHVSDSSVPVAKLSSNNESSSTLDASEWKPRFRRGPSAASVYLSRFHRSSPTLDDDNEENVYESSERRRSWHKSSQSLTNTPSLGSSMSSTASSFESRYGFSKFPQSMPKGGQCTPRLHLEGQPIASEDNFVDAADASPDIEQHKWEKKTITKSSENQVGLGSLLTSPQ